MKTTRIIVSGIVQGVGFRYFTLRLAERYNITGWVRNNSNGTVEMMVTGEDIDMQDFTNEVILGHRFSKVEGVDIQNLEYRRFEIFEIINSY